MDGAVQPGINRKRAAVISEVNTLLVMMSPLSILPNEKGYRH